MKYLLLTIVFGLACCHQPVVTGPAVGEAYDTAKPPLVAGNCAYIRSVTFSRHRNPNAVVNFQVYDSSGSALPQFTVKALKKPYTILANITYFITDQEGRTRVSYNGCDSLELANLSILSGKPCRLGTDNLPDSVTITLTLTQVKFIPSTL